MTECYAWALSPQWSYYKHPPFVAWVIAAFFKVVPPSQLAYFFLSQCQVILAYAGLWCLAKEVFSSSKLFFDTSANDTATPHPGGFTQASRYAVLLSVLLCETIFFYTSHSTTLNHNTILLPLWSWAIYLGYQAFIKHPKNALVWMGFGVMAALTLYGKYYSGALLVSITVWSLMTKATRILWRTPMPYLALATMGFCLIPHVVATLEQGQGTLSYAEDLIHWDSFNIRLSTLKSFTVSQIAHVLPLLVVLGVGLKGKVRGVFGRLFQAWRKTIRLPQYSYLWAVSVGSCLVTLVLCIMIGVKTSSKWAFPMWGVLPMACLAMIPDGYHYRRLLTGGILLTCGVPCFILVQSLMGFGHQRGFLYDQPVDSLAHYITRQWHTQYHAPLRYVGGILHLPTSVSFYSTDHPLSLLHLDYRTSPWVTRQALQKSGMVILCHQADKGCQLKANILARNLTQQTIVTTLWQAPSGHRRLAQRRAMTYWLMWLAPQA
jgi:4-amino-4-deoxy-L-arabinose transferase-like glycosyltransferase